MATIEQLTTTHRHETDLTKLSGTVQAVVQSRMDVVAPEAAFNVDADNIYAGALVDPSGEPIITDSGVMPAETRVTLTRTAVRNLAERRRIPLNYLDRLDGEGGDHRALAAHSLNELGRLDDRSAMFRLLQADDGTLLRSVHSNQYGVFDNDLALRALLEGLDAAGFGLGDCEIEGDYTADRLRLRVHVPSVSVEVPELLGDYRMPFSMREDRRPHDPPAPGERPPVIFAGFEIGNSETGSGSLQIAKRAVIGVCRNGLKKDVTFKRAHVGARLDDGEVAWSDATRQKVYELISSQVRDVVSECLTTAHLDELVNEMKAAKGIEIESPQRSIEVVGEQFQLTEAERDAVFDCFARGGDQTALGVANAVTAAAQLVDDGDRQAEMETAFWKIVERPTMVAVSA